MSGTAATALPTFSKVDASKIDFSQYEDVSDNPPGSNGGGAGMMDGMGDGIDGMEVDPEGKLLGDHWSITHLEKQDVGKTLDVFPKVYGKGAITKKLLAAGSEFDNPGVAAELSYQARVVGGDGTPFETLDKQIVALDVAAFPFGVEAAIKTMREGECALITVQPDKAFGATGDASKGVPPDSYVEYEVTCHRVIETVRLDEGRIVKRRMVRGERWEKPGTDDDLTVQWKGWLKGDEASVFHEEGILEWTAGDESVPAVFNKAVVGHMLKNEVSEIEVAPAAGCVAPGFEQYAVPADRTVVLSVKLLSWVAVADISDEQDGRVSKRALVMGEGWEKPRTRYWVTVDLKLRQKVGDKDPLVVCDGLELVLGSVSENSQVASFGSTCGGADLGVALELALPKMQLGEKCELRCTSQSVGGAGLVAVVTLVSWVVVEPVPQTDYEVTRRVITAADKDYYERPVQLSTATVRYVVRPKDSDEVIESSGDEPITFIVSDGSTNGILPCIDTAVRELKRGEKDIITAPTQWAYTSPEYLPAASGVPSGAAEKTREGVAVELELVDFVRGKDFYQLDGDEKLAEMIKYREKGNRLFKAGPDFTKRAIARYHDAIRKEPQDHDYTGSEIEMAEKTAKLEEVRKQKLSIHLNLAAAHLRLDEAKKALTQCSNAIGIDPSNVKALYRRGQAKLKLEDVEGARSDLLQAAKRDPQNKEVRKELEKLKELSTAYKQHQKNAFGGMFS